MAVVLGIGSSFADDQAGILVARQLLATNSCQSKINSGELVVEFSDRPGLNLLNWLKRDHVKLFLIDMVKTNLAEPGNIYMLPGSEILGFSGILSSHSLGVSGSMALAVALGMNIDKVTFWGIEGENHVPTGEISRQVLNAVNKVTQQILEQLGCYA